MGIPNKQIGWSQESILLHGVSKQLERLAAIIATSGGGGGGGTGVVITIIPGTNITVDNTNPAYPIVSSNSVNSITGGNNIQVDNTDPLHPVISTTADDIVVVVNYNALPPPNTVPGKFYWASTPQGNRWLPGVIGGTFYDSGLYYSNGSTWEYLEVPYQASQAEVNAGLVTDKFVTPFTLNGIKQNAMTPVDGTGVKIPTIDGVNLFGNNILKVTASTGFIDRLDPYKMVLTNPTTLTITGSNPGAFVRTKLFIPPFAPSDAIVNISARTIAASSISLLSDGRYFRFLGYDYATDSITASSVSFLDVDNIVQLSYVEILRSGGVNTFTVLQQEPDLSTTALFEATMIPNQTTVRVFPNGNLTVNNNAGIIRAHNISWGVSSNPHIKSYSSANPSSFIRIDPSYLNTSTGFAPTISVDVTTYWDGGAIVPVPSPNNATIQRWLVTLDGRLLLQAGDTIYATKALADAAINSVTFQDIFPSDIVIEVARMVTTKSATSLTDITKVQFYYGSGAGGGGGSAGGSGFVNINGVSQDIAITPIWRTAQADTGVLTFGSGLTPGSPAATTINIAPITGLIVDNETNPNVPAYVYITYPGETNKVVTTIGSGQGSYVMLGVGNVISFQTTLPTAAERKTKIWLGKVAHPAGVITAVINEPDYITSPQAFSRDLFQALGPYINDSVFPYANGANLNMNITQGSIYGNGINLNNSNTIPNRILTGPFTPVTFLPRTQTGAGGGGTTFIDPGFYDVAGVITPIPNPPATSTNRYVFVIPGTGFIVQYGQVLYATLTEAIANVGKEAFTIFSNLVGNAILIGVISIRKDATQLNDVNQARFFRADKLGQLIGAQAGVSTSTMQNTYNNSLTPQIIVSDVLGAMTVRSGRALDSSTIYEWQNIAGVTKASMTGNGDLTVNTISAYIGTNVQAGTSYTLLNTDNGKQIITTNAGAVTITIPAGLTSGFNCEVLQQGTGQVSFVASGITLHYSTFELPSIVERYGIVGIDNMPNVANEYNLYGKLTSI